MEWLEILLPVVITIVNYICCCCLVTTLCLTLFWPHERSPPGSSVQGISQARVLEWVAISSCRESSLPRDGTHVSCISALAGGFFYLSHQGSPGWCLPWWKFPEYLLHLEPLIKCHGSSSSASLPSVQVKVLAIIIVARPCGFNLHWSID